MRATSSIVIIFSVLLASIICNTLAQTCDDTQGTGTFNPSCTNKKYPYCVQTVQSPALYQCVACVSNCDCNENQYCSKKIGAIGTCIKFDRYGKSCRPLSPSQLADLDYPDDWKCADTYSNNGNLAVDAAGVCIGEKCRYCDYVNQNGGFPGCGTTSGLKTERTCVHPGILVPSHSSEWKIGKYYETPENVWWAIFFVFFMILIGIQGAILFFTFRG